MYTKRKGSSGWPRNVANCFQISTVDQMTAKLSAVGSAECSLVLTHWGQHSAGPEAVAHCMSDTEQVHGHRAELFPRVTRTDNTRESLNCWVTPEHFRNLVAVLCKGC